MAAFDPTTLDRWRSLAIVDRDGSTVGTIIEFYLDRETGHPTWALVNTGLFGTTQTFVPVLHATEISDGLQVPYDKRHIRDTPRVDLHDELTPDEEAILFAHYGVDYEPLLPGDAEAGSSEAVAVVEAEPEPDEAGAVVDGDPGSAVVDAEPGSVVVDAEPGSVVVDAEPGTVVVDPDPGSAVVDPEQGPVVVDPEPGSGPGGRVPDEPGTTSPDDATQVGSMEAADPDLGRTAPVAPGLPGSTASSPYESGPATIDKDADPSQLPTEDPFRPPGEPVWAPGASGFEEYEPIDRPTSASDRWREAKLAAERDRIARAAAQPEERSPLERARRRLERLVGVGGQDHPDPEGISPADRDAAERARRARLGLDEEDDRRR